MRPVNRAGAPIHSRRRFRPFHAIILVGYIAFIGLALNSRVVDAFVFYVMDQNGQQVLATGQISTKPIVEEKPATPREPTVVAVQFHTDASPNAETASFPLTISMRHPDEGRPDAAPTNTIAQSSGNPAQFASNPTAAGTGATPTAKPVGNRTNGNIRTEAADAGNLPRLPAPTGGLLTPRETAVSSRQPGRQASRSDVLSAGTDRTLKGSPAPQGADRTADKGTTTEDSFDFDLDPGSTQSGKPSKAANVPEPNAPASVLTLLKSINHKPWKLDRKLNRYVVQHDAETLIVLTLRPNLQRLLEETFDQHSAQIGVGIIQDPRTGAILAMSTREHGKTLRPEDRQFVNDNWALKASFPVASIFKIITAAAGLDKGKITIDSSILAWKKHSMTVWEAFAKSHNGVFGRIAQRVGRPTLQTYANAFGFNKPFYFDLPVEASTANLPTNTKKFGEAAAGLNKFFTTSPMHVAAMVSAVLNRGRLLKPYLVDYILKGDKVVFRRQPFPLGQPLKADSAREIYRMMYSTTSMGTGKRGFSGYHECPDLIELCGGKTGTLTGDNPKYLFTWFGGFTRTAGRDLCIVTLIGQKGRGGVRAATLAGQLSYELYQGRGMAPTPVASPARLATGKTR
jgi:penicillin-binding protein A